MLGVTANRFPRAVNSSAGPEPPSIPRAFRNTESSRTTESLPLPVTTLPLRLPTLLFSRLLARVATSGAGWLALLPVLSMVAWACGYRWTAPLLAIALTVTLVELAVGFPFALWLAKGGASKATRAIVLALLTIPFFLDEIETLDPANRRAVIQTAKKLGFIAITAAPSAVGEVDSCYFLEPDKRGRVVLSDEQRLVLKSKAEPKAK